MDTHAALFLQLFFALLFHGGAGETYLGCYKDTDFSVRLLGGLKTVFEENLTIKGCLDHCKSSGFRYAGVEWKVECFCSNDRPSFKQLADDADCSAKCSGNEAEVCGGNFRINVYDIKDVSLNAVADRYVGCFEDSDTNRHLPKARRDTDLLTPEYCVGYCFRRGYRFAGVQYGKECYCGDNLDESRKKDNSDCSADCKGDVLLRCGGNWRLSIYKTGITDDPLDDVNYLGCFKDSNPDVRVLSAVNFELKDSNTPKRCLNLCLSEGYKYSGTQYRVECFCGNRKPSLDKEIGEDKCRMPCPGDRSQHCGGEWALLVYSTATTNRLSEEVLPTTARPPISTTRRTVNCRTSPTTVNGKKACSGEVIFEDDFKRDINPGKWSHEIFMPWIPDYEFVTFSKNPQNSYVSNGKLIIEPTIKDENFVLRGKVQLNNCTGQQYSEECERTAVSYNILPPIESANIHTKNSFSFRYGVVEIRAKLPLGDWISPDIWLKPTWKAYGPGLSSGRVRLAFARGNPGLLSDGEDIGNRVLHCEIMMGKEDNIKRKTIVKTRRDEWHNDFHNFTFTWRPSSMSFMVDGENEEVLVPPSSGRLAQLLGFDAASDVTWSSGSSLAPFDQEFYIALGLTVGGMRDYPDGSLSGNTEKPWKNWGVKSMFNFWKGKDSWHSTWKYDATMLQVESVRVTAL